MASSESGLAGRMTPARRNPRTAGPQFTQNATKQVSKNNTPTVPGPAGRVFNGAPGAQGFRRGNPTFVMAGGSGGFRNAKQKTFAKQRGGR